MKLQTVATYQAVRFNKHDEKHFDPRIPRFANIEMTYDAQRQLVQISMPGTESIYIFPANIAYMVAKPELQDRKFGKVAKAD
jgi:hypothetical protein